MFSIKIHYEPLALTLLKTIETIKKVGNGFKKKFSGFNGNHYVYWYVMNFIGMMLNPIQESPKNKKKKGIW